jgi:3-oxoacyl-[acyl-carrier protein] reductase
MDMNLEGKHALVAGASQGIGLAAAQALAALGCRVTLLARNAERLDAALGTLARRSADGAELAHAVAVADFSAPETVATAAADVAARGPVNILVNNTGGPPAGLAHTAEVAAFQAAFEQHLICNHLLAQACIPGMRSSGYGRIVNVISTSVKIPLNGLGVSNTIRGAVANWAKTLANELGPDGITVNNVLPGPTRTARLDQIAEGKAAKVGGTAQQALDAMAAAVPLKRLGDPEEVGAAVAFLASPAAAYINGVNLPVDGGRTGCL